MHTLLLEKPKTRVLLIKIPIEDYQAYKIFADQMFYESNIYNGINLVKNELRANAVNDENLKF